MVGKIALSALALKVAMAATRSTSAVMEKRIAKMLPATLLPRKTKKNKTKVIASLPRMTGW